MSFDYPKFTEEVYSKYKAFLSKEEVNELLDLDDEYNRDTPIATGKRLIITSVQFKGEKSNGNTIDYFQEINTGINIWIADNLKGKSSVFKIIKFALTGSNKLKDDIKKWLTSILLVFRINDRDYSIYLDLHSNVLSARLYGEKIDSLSIFKESEVEPIIEARGLEQYQNLIEDFFFKQFSYYSLKWTQKDPRKDVNRLREANSSWKIYFKSILLESKDSNSMYGDQEKKIFQMLLGLALTYPINRLTIKKEQLEFEKGKYQSLQNTKHELEKGQKEQLEKRLGELNLRISQHDSSIIEKVSVRNIFQEYDFIISEINLENSRNNSNQNRLQEKRNELHSITSQKELTKYELSGIRKELLRATKSIAELQEFMDIGIFFSNLDIKYCPNCNHEVSNHRKRIEQAHKECSLCHELIQNTENTIDKEMYLKKIENLQLIKKNFSQEEVILEERIENLHTEYNVKSKTIESLERQLNSTNNLIALKEKLSELEEIINVEKGKVLANENEKYELISEKAVIEFQLQQMVKVINNESENNLNITIDLLKYSIAILKTQRYELGTRILQHLSELMLSEINAFGLSSITKVNISESFDISYMQNGDFVSFDKIAEGEQLRVKIAFYLSLIQLDIEHNFGRHTRLLIIDSPSKEEGDSKYIHGLSNVLRSIESRFGDKLQILIGTAERDLSNITNNQIIIDEDKFLF